MHFSSFFQATFFPVLLKRYQNFLSDHDLGDSKQFLDFSVSYFVENRFDFGALGYLKHHRTNKMQISFGISTGMDDIPTALGIQNGNESDKRHFMEAMHCSYLQPRKFACHKRLTPRLEMSKWLNLCVFKEILTSFPCRT